MILFAIGIIALYIIAVYAGLKKGFSAGSIFGMTIGFGIITCENKNQAIKRSSEINKGIEAASACIKMIRGKQFGFDKF